MKLGVLTNLLGGLPAEQAFKYLAESGVQAVEIGCGGYPGKDHCKPEELLKDEKKIAEFKAMIEGYGLTISALSCHGNPVHPQKELADAFDQDFRNAILLAEKLGVDRIVGFSGCPGDCPTSQYPNWVTCAWPDDYLKILDYQWNEVLIPYWKNMVAFAKEHGINKIAFEMHPGFCVYNPETLLKLREAVGPEIGANFDPSHLIWQGIDPARAIIELKDCIYHFHAKDTKIDQYNNAVNGVLDYKHYSKVAERSWVFRTIGYGHDVGYWKDIVSALRTIDYDYVMSIEHEDSLIAPTEGLQKAIKALKEAMTFEEKGGMWWA
ncbi:MAG: sugar phosphate isomerase/epimerase [Ruminococcaceae bacterium]|nr:sugar phosphate isomerase/epimerase [Oscillospiraceae bacterium]